MTNNPPVLCYVTNNWAYFTTQKLQHQWGDDWDDAPYEHNSGTPYEFQDHDRKEGRQPWEITKVAWDGDFEAPCSGHCNSHFSVEAINSGAVAWLRSCVWKSGPTVAIPAGTTLERFIELITSNGGSVYLKSR